MTTTTETPPGTNQTLANGLNILRQCYRRSIRNCAEDLIRNCRDGTIKDDEALDEHLHQTCDGMDWVIITYKAQITLLVSENCDAAIDAVGLESLDFSAGPPWSQLAYYAVYADILRHLESLDFDANDASTWPETEETDG